MSKTDSGDYLDNLRHSAAHLLAAAVVKLWSDTKLAIGPAIENGFYYDFDFGEIKISDKDFSKIEEKMRELVKSWTEFTRVEISWKDAQKKFSKNPYKLELIDEFKNEDKKLTIYKSGDFEDLCRGGHIENPAKELHHLKLLSVAGAYWRGSEKNKMLTRIYGTAWPTKADLQQYLKNRQQAETKDNRKLGRELELYTINPAVGPGLILWLPKGTILREEIEKLGKEVEAKYGYQRVTTPHIGKEELYLTSGHLPYYAADMWPPMEYEGERYYVKPMNCPHMHMIYKFKPRSYKDLPVRYAEFGTVYRHEDSGALTGLLRVRGHTTNDAHIYCSEKQVISEIIQVMKMHSFYYNLFGIKDYHVELALPDFKNKADKYFKDLNEWDKAIGLLRQAAQQIDIRIVEKEGEAAFYGPKFDFNIKSVVGRQFGASTNQLDFGSGKRFGLTYTDKDGLEKIVPYVIHRAPLGSEERFIGFLIEHFGGAFPTWLAPVQAEVIPVSEKSLAYAKKVAEKLSDSSIRNHINESGETVGKKIREAEKQKVPYMLVVGPKEAESNSVAVRARGEVEIGQMPFAKFINSINKEISSKSLESLVKV